MAYRKQWYTFGIRTTSDIDSLAATDLTNGDTVYNVDIDKPEYLLDTSAISPYYSASKIWSNEDCVLVQDFYRVTNPCNIGNVVSLMLGVYSSPGNTNTWVEKCGTGVARYAGQFLGVVNRYEVGLTGTTSQNKMVAIQGIYDVKFTSATINVTAGNYAILSATAGECSQGSSTASTGAVGIIMETKTLDVDRLAKVMIQSFSSR